MQTERIVETYSTLGLTGPVIVGPEPTAIGLFIAALECFEDPDADDGMGRTNGEIGEELLYYWKCELGLVQSNECKSLENRV